MRPLRLTLPQLWQLLAVLLPILGTLATGLSTVDLAYHVRAGSEFLDTGRIPLADTFTFTAAGESWLNQQWLSQILLAGTFRLAGWEGLALLRAVLVGITFAGILRACRSAGTGPRTAALLTLAAFVVSLVALALRPQLFAMALFALALVLVVERHRHPGWLWGLPVLGLLWTNLHGSFVLLPVLIGAAWLEDVGANGPAARRLVRVGLLTVAATLVNPFGLGVWQYAIGLTTNPSVTSRISEWQPPSIRSVLGVLFYGSALGVAAFLARRPGRVPWPTLLWLAFLFVLGAMAARGVAWWPLGAAVAVAGLLGPGSAPDRPRERANVVNSALAGALLVAVVAALPWWRPPSAVTGRDGLLLYAPADLTVALRSIAGPSDRIFNPQAWGSWFELAVPAAPVFVDSRIELFDTSVWDDYTAVTDGREGWREVLSKRAVTIVVIDSRRDPDLADRLSRDTTWTRIYHDGDGVILVHRPPVTQ